MLIRSTTLVETKRFVAVAAAFAILVTAIPALQTSVTGMVPTSMAPATGAGAQPRVLQSRDNAIHFERNDGQVDPSVLYVAHESGSVLYFAPTEIVISLASHEGASAEVQLASDSPLVTLEFVGANAAAISPGGSLPARANYITDNNPANWHTEIPTYSALTYSNLYKGIQLRYEGTNTQLKGTYSVAPWASPADIRWRYRGVGVALDSAGDLQLTPAGVSSTGSAMLTERAPVAWQDAGGKRVMVDIHYALGADGSIGFALDSYDRSLPLIIDPAITYSTYLGGSIDDYGSDIATDGAGNAYVVGFTNSTDFPVRNAYQGSKLAQSDVFISKFNSDGTLAFSTYFGGTNIDYGYGIALDPSGAIYITGQTTSVNFPVANAYQGFGGSVDVFVSKFSNNGQSLLYSTYLGASGDEYAYGIAADAAGNAYVEGYTYSDGFPTRNAYQAARAGNFDAFVTRLNTNASGNSSLVYSTYLGGSQPDYGSGTGMSAFGHGVATDGAGNVYVTGTTYSNNFPSRNGYQPTRNPSANSDAWIAKLNTGSSGDASLLYSTFLGGSNGDDGRDIALDPAGSVYVTGDARSINFPIRSGMSACTTNSQPFVAKFNMSLSGDASLLYSTCFGSRVTGSASAIEVGGSGEATILGYDASANWPLVNQLQTWGGAQDLVLAKLNAAGNGLKYSTYLGGSGNDFGRGMASDSNGFLYLTGQTQSTDYPVLNPFQASQHGGGDGFVTRIDECPVTFSDVHTSDYFYEPVRYLSCKGVITGYSDNTFRPGNTTTRGQMTKIVVLGFGMALYSPGADTFNDVPAGSTFYPYVETAVHNNIVSGYECGAINEPCPGRYFRPGASVTRGQLSKIVVIAAQLARGWSLSNPTQPTFSDVPVGSTFYSYVETAACHGLVSGYSCGGASEPCPGQYFRPSNSATRGQISKIVYLAIVGTTSCGTGVEVPWKAEAQLPEK